MAKTKKPVEVIEEELEVIETPMKSEFVKKLNSDEQEVYDLSNKK